MAAGIVDFFEMIHVHQPEDAGRDRIGTRTEIRPAGHACFAGAASMIDAVGPAGQFHGCLKAAAIQRAGQSVVKGLMLEGEALFCFRINVGDAAHNAGAAFVIHKITGLNAAPERGVVSAQQPDFDVRLFCSLRQCLKQLPQFLPVLFVRLGTERFLRRAYGRGRRTVKDRAPE